MLTLRSRTLQPRRLAGDHAASTPLLRGHHCWIVHPVHASGPEQSATPAKGGPSQQPPATPEGDDRVGTKSEYPSSNTGWCGLADGAEDWSQESWPQKPPQTIHEPQMSGMMFLMAVIVGLSAVTWQISRLFASIPPHRKLDITGKASTIIADRRRAGSFRERSHKAAAPAKSETTAADQQSSDTTGYKVQENLASTQEDSGSSDTKTDAGPGSTKQTEPQETQISRLSAAHEQPGPDSASTAVSSSEPDKAATSAGLGVTIDEPAAEGEIVRSQSSEASAGQSESAAHPKIASLPQPSEADAAAALVHAPSTRAGPEQASPGSLGIQISPTDASRDLPSSSVAVTPSEPDVGADLRTSSSVAPKGSTETASRQQKPESAQNLHAKDEATTVRPTVQAPTKRPIASVTPQPPWLRSAKSHSVDPSPPMTVKIPLEQPLSMRAPSDTAADHLPAGRGLAALRERAQLALRAAAAASEASQRAAAHSAAASSAASQAADAAERSAAAATAAQAALESEAEGAIFAAEERAQRAAGLAHDAEQRAAQSAGSAVAYQQLAQGQAAVAAKAARIPSDGNANIKGDRTVSVDGSARVPQGSMFKALTDAWKSLTGDSGAGTEEAPQTDMNSSATIATAAGSDRGSEPWAGGQQAAARTLPPSPSSIGTATQRGKGLDVGLDAPTDDHSHIPPVAEKAQDALHGLSSTMKGLWHKMKSHNAPGG